MSPQDGVGMLQQKHILSKDYTSNIPFCHLVVIKLGVTILDLFSMQE